DVRDGAGTSNSDDGEVDRRLGRRAYSTDGRSARVDFDDVGGGETTLVQARRGDCEPQRHARDNDAKVAARRGGPAAAVSITADGYKRLGGTATGALSALDVRPGS